VYSLAWWCLGGGSWWGWRGCLLGVVGREEVGALPPLALAQCPEASRRPPDSLAPGFRLAGWLSAAES
jgi:hypothetical protein